ncbi:YicC/YloC family endoribonuclease [Haloimpatiens lingqiaonensis]|uniref:YicC/YloC family endoribonuclease n=1 Tax=Haloimpatiens lingqiaonensis TaxID=1380675 RepID=UPI0010FD5CE1|nr:YicC/YloC family endoribonuclease [Haloimpatiens lingqiaonensis]
MIKSMTGFGRATSQGEKRSFDVEIKTVNHRYLDINIRLPKSLLSLEENIRKLISEKLKRGKVDLFITQNILQKEDLEAKFNKKLADSYVRCLEEIRGTYSVRDDISVSLIAKFPDVISLEYKEEDLEEIWNCLKKPLEKALELLVEMRKREGNKLKEDIISRCQNIKDMVDAVAQRAPQIPIEYKEKLQNRLKDLMDEHSIDEGRLAMEVAIFADKACIDEEIVRLNSHIEQLKVTLDLEESVGRKLDFIVQEMNREANTIGSKANDLEICNFVLNMKSEIEKIREQIQNVE